MNQNSADWNQSRPARMAQHRVVDQQHQGLVVSTFAHPGGWRAQSQVVWNTQHTSLPVVVSAVTFNPNGAESFEFLPMQVFFWLENDFGTVPIGQNSRGLVRMPPRPAPDALANLVIPYFRGGRQNFRVTDVQPVPNLWEVFKDPPPQRGEGLMARVEYEERGRAIEEEFYGVYSWNQGMQLNWGFERLICFRAERGRLDAMRETFWRIAGSLQLNPQWKQLYDQVMQQLTAGFNVHIESIYNKLRVENEIGRQNIAYNEHLNNQRNASVNASIERQRQLNEERPQSQHAYTRQEAFGDALVHQTAFHDPNSAEGNYHYEQGNPGYTYTDGRGNWYSTDDPYDDPNGRLDGHWVPAEQVKIRN